MLYTKLLLLFYKYIVKQSYKKKERDSSCILSNNAFSCCSILFIHVLTVCIVLLSWMLSYDQEEVLDQDSS